MMRKIILSTLIGICGTAFAQDVSEINEKDIYNKWSFECNIGQNKPIRPFSEGYYASNPTKAFSFSGGNHFDLGIRYMMSNTFGLKFDYGYDQFKNIKDKGSLPFNTKLNRLGLQGVINLGRLLHFESFTNRLGVLAHGGIQISNFHVSEGVNKNTSEANGGLMFGITPQVRLNKQFALTADFTVINNVKQHLNWDGSQANTNENLFGVLYNTSIGITMYLGKNNVHADWYVCEPPYIKANAAALKRIESIETLMNDTDRDGVPDYLDAQNNTPTGVAVDTKGRFFDGNTNNIPDELEVNNGKETPTIAKSAETELVESGLVNIFFDANLDTPNTGSTNNIYIIIHYLKENPTAKAKLNGYTDMRGDEKKNKELSIRRAQNVFALLVSCEIAPDRITIEGRGNDLNYKTDSINGLGLARRVSVQIVK